MLGAVHHVEQFGVTGITSRFFEGPFRQCIFPQHSCQAMFAATLNQIVPGSKIKMAAMDLHDSIQLTEPVSQRVCCFGKTVDRIRHMAEKTDAMLRILPVEVRRQQQVRLIGTRLPSGNPRNIRFFSRKSQIEFSDHWAWMAQWDQKSMFE